MRSPLLVSASIQHLGRKLFSFATRENAMRDKGKLRRIKMLHNCWYAEAFHFGKALMRRHRFQASMRRQRASFKIEGGASAAMYGPSVSACPQPGASALLG